VQYEKKKHFAMKTSLHWPCWCMTLTPGGASATAGACKSAGGANPYQIQIHIVFWYICTVAIKIYRRGVQYVKCVEHGGLLISLRWVDKVFDWSKVRQRERELTMQRPLETGHCWCLPPQRAFSLLVYYLSLLDISIAIKNSTLQLSIGVYYAQH